MHLNWGELPESGSWFEVERFHLPDMDVSVGLDHECERNQLIKDLRYECYLKILLILNKPLEYILKEFSNVTSSVNP